MALGALFVFMMVLPFLAGLQNILGLFIIGVALYEAWKITRPLRFTIAGPFALAAAGTGAASAGAGPDPGAGAGAASPA